MFPEVLEILERVFFFLVYFMLFEQNEKLKTGGSVEAVVIPLTEL